MKKHSIFKVIGITIIVAVLLTWIFPVTYYGYNLVEEPRRQVGLFEFFTMGPVLFYYFGSVIFYILAIGGFYGVLHKIDGYRNLLDKIVKKFKGKEHIFLSVIMIIFALVTSMAGLTTGLLFLFPFVIAVILLMGYNKQTAAFATIGSIAIGLIGTTVSATSTDAIVGILGIKYSSELLTKGIILLVGLVLLVYNVLSYAKKHKDNKKDTEEDIILPVSKDTKKKAWPIVVVIDLIILIMILSSISWESVLGVKLFNDIHTSVMSAKINGFALFGKLLGENTAAAFGKWTLYEFIPIILFGIGIIALLYRVKFNDFIKSFYEGMKKAFKPALLVFFAYIVLVITATHPVLLTIFKPLLTATSGFNVFTMSIVAFFSSVFNIEAYYAASGILPYVTSIITDTKTYPLIAVVWQAMYGLTALIAPTSLVLIATLSYLNISFGQWIKTSWKLILEILAALLLIFTILILI